MRKKKQKLNHPYKAKTNGKNLVLIIAACFLLVVSVSYGLSYLESFLVYNQVEAANFSQATTLAEYSENGYLGEFGKTYTVGVTSFEKQYEFDYQNLLTYFN